jgi:hypothetical protein
MILEFYKLNTNRSADKDCDILSVNELPKDVRKSTSNITPPEYCNYPISSIEFSNRGTALKCYSAGMGAPRCRIQRLDRDGSNNVSVNKLGLDLDSDTTEWFFIDDPFFGCHEVLSHVDPNPPSCRDIRLSFATVTLESQSQTIACILRSCTEVPGDDCNHVIQLDQPHAIASTPSIQVVARLWGFKLPKTSMAAVMAFSKKGTRIAIASWDKIFVWPLQPEALAEKWDNIPVYTRTYDQNLRSSVVELQPIVLKADAVVHKMAFTGSEDELVTMTDRGVQIWNLGPSATGRREIGLLYDGHNKEKAERKETLSAQQEEVTLKPPPGGLAVLPRIDASKIVAARQKAQIWLPPLAPVADMMQTRWDWSPGSIDNIQTPAFYNFRTRGRRR